MKKIILGIILLTASLATTAQRLQVKSPDGNIALDVMVSDKITYSVYAGGELLLSDNEIALRLKEITLGENPRLKSYKITSQERSFKPAVAYKFSEIHDKYNQLRIDFKDGWALEFRAYDDGAAYRFVTAHKGDMEVYDEKFVLKFPDAYSSVLQQPGGFKTAYEEPYTFVETSDWKPNDKMSVLPVLIDTRKGYKILFSESALTQYPCMFLKGGGDNSMVGTFPKYPLKTEQWGDRYLHPVEEADYIARTSGTRAFPWRYFVIAGNDDMLIENTMTARLAEKTAVEDLSWLKPGQVSWEFWSFATAYGPDVDFVAGFNTETYKYYIDFAARYGLPYIIMDEGWAKTTDNPYEPNPKVDVHELIRYGKEKGVGIILWMTWLAVENNFDAFEVLSGWGVKGLKLDFMDRSDQWMVDYYERVAAEAAKHKMVISFHGSFKPSGLEYKYPNVLTYEGVRGMEQMGSCTPSNSVWFPFLRNAVGPMDYTPGAMISMHPESYCGHRPNAAGVGTRAYQLALYVVFESGLQMLSDTPSLYYRDPDCTQFISKVPVEWDETRSLNSVAGKYAIVAKRKGEKWHIGAINGSNTDAVEVEINLDFLTPGKGYDMSCFEDGINAHRQAMDYRQKQQSVKAGDKIGIKMSRNGGWAAVIE